MPFWILAKRCFQPLSRLTRCRPRILRRIADSQLIRFGVISDEEACRQNLEESESKRTKTRLLEPKSLAQVIRGCCKDVAVLAIGRLACDRLRAAALVGLLYRKCV